MWVTAITTGLHISPMPVLKYLLVHDLQLFVFVGNFWLKFIGQVLQLFATTF